MFDGDTTFTTDNPVLLRKHVETLTILCIQSTAKKSVVTEAKLAKSNEMGFNNDVGGITNVGTSMFNVITNFSKDSEEYKIIKYRIACMQLYQQACLDAIKGCETTEMPSYWKNIDACETEEQAKLCTCGKKPYFMTYVYKTLMTERKNTIKRLNTRTRYSTRDFVDIVDMIKKEPQELTDYEKECVDFYNSCTNLMENESTVNHICYAIEKEFDKYGNKLIEDRQGTFDYSLLMTKTAPLTKLHKSKIDEIYKTYKTNVTNFTSNKWNKDDGIDKKACIENGVRIQFYSLCQEYNIRIPQICNYVVTQVYENNSMTFNFMINIFGEQIVKNIIANKEEE